MKQIFTGLEFMHANRVVHCDLKPDNFLFKTKDENAVLKIIDFGMSKRLPRSQTLKMLCGTPYYTAPEILQKRYTRAADMWSAGVVMFVMLFGYPPFYVDPTYGAKENDMIYKKIKRGFSPKIKKGYGSHFPAAIPISDEARDLIASLLKKNPADRPTAKECLDHEWINSHGKRGSAIKHSNVIAAVKQFKNDCKFKLIVCDLFREKLRPDQLKNCKELFQAADLNKDGKISLNEFKATMSKLTALSNKDLDDMFKNLDIDGDGELTYTELLTAATHEHLLGEDERLYDAFCALDKDGDGFISPDELEEA
eukprot:UN06794